MRWSARVARLDLPLFGDSRPESTKAAASLRRIYEFTREAVEFLLDVGMNAGDPGAPLHHG